MARELLLLWVGRHHRQGWEEICSRYRKRIARVMPVREIPLKVRRRGGEREQLAAEAEALLAALPDPVWTIALDRRGEALSSAKLAAELGRLRREWPHPVAFLVGSDLGLDPALLKRVRKVWSLGPMTLSHELARVVLYEQLYRFAAIEAGTKYHRSPT